MPKTKTTWTQKNPGPGRPRGSVTGRKKCLQLIDELLQNEDNQEKLREDFQKLFDENPSGFYKKFVEPILPKDYNIIDEKEVMEISFVDLILSANEMIKK